MMKTNGFLAVALTLTVATLAAFIGLAPEAHAAAFHVVDGNVLGSMLAFPHEAVEAVKLALNHSGSAIYDAVSAHPQLALTLAVMRTNLADLKTRAEAKAGEVKDDMSPAAVRKIEGEHDTLLREIAKLEADIQAKEAEEAAEAQRQEQTRTNPSPAPQPVNAQAVARQAVTDERTRSNAIRSLAATGSPEVIALATEHIDNGSTVETFRSAMLDLLIANGGAPTNSNTRVQVGQSDHEKRAVGVANALLHRSDGSIVLTDEGRNFRGMSLLEIGRDLLEARGVNTRGMSRNELAGEALQMRTGGMMTTSDFGGILANVANTRLRAAYEAAPQTFRPLVRVASVPDFKAVTRVQIGEAPALNKVNEHGEFKRGSLGEGKESYKIATYGKIIGITRQVIVNDDLDAFSRIPAAFGVQAAQLESDLVWAQILSNPIMGDGNALFSTAHGNLAGSGAVISVTTMSGARVAFSTQTGLDGKTVLGLAPRYLIVPVSLLTSAEQFLAPIVPAQTANAVPESLRRLSIIAEPRLDVGINRPEDDIVASGSATAWYLAGDTGTGDIVELAYLDGNQGIYTETRAGFDIDGVEIKARLDVGAKVLEHRNLYKNPGA